MPQRLRLAPLCAILALILSAALLSAACSSPETDRAALAALYNSTDGPNWRSSDNWLSDAPLGEWRGVTTGNNGRVIELDLRVNQLSGEIPPELGNLANLTGLSLNGNQLSGEIPPELGNLANLKYLVISQNQLSGEIPPELGNLANLTWLGLNNNELSGEIPPELGNHFNLEELYLNDNQLNGCVPNGLLRRLSSESNLGDLPPC